MLVGRSRFAEGMPWQSMAAYFRQDLCPVEIIDTPVDGLRAVLAEDPDFDVVCPSPSRVGAEEIRLGRFGLIQQFGAGLDTVDVAAATAAGVWVCNLPGLNASEVAEHALLLTLGAARGVPSLAEGFAPERWGQLTGRAIADSTVCIVGMGAIGGEIAARLRPFGVKMLSVRRNADLPLPPALDDVELMHDLNAALSQADIAIVAASFDPAAGPILTERQFASMRAGTILVNIGRGGLIDEESLLRALDDGTVAWAGLDVFSTEPYPPDGPLVQHPHVFATPHVSAITDRFFRRASAAFGEALFAYARGEEPPHAVTSLPTPRAHAKSRR